MRGRRRRRSSFFDSHDRACRDFNGRFLVLVGGLMNSTMREVEMSASKECWRAKLVTLPN